jgi:hypothetical protein
MSLSDRAESRPSLRFEPSVACNRSTIVKRALVSARSTAWTTSIRRSCDPKIRWILIAGGSGPAAVTRAES